MKDVMAFSAASWEGKFVRPKKAETSKSDGRYRPGQTDFVKSFYAVLGRWESETSVISDPAKIKAHPSFVALVQNAELTLPYILDEMRRGPSRLVWVMKEAFSDRPFAPSTPGNLKQLTEAWVGWGEEHGPER